MLGLSYSDDEDDEQQPQRPGEQATTGTAATVSGGLAVPVPQASPAGIVGLAAYGDSDEEDETPSASSATAAPAGSVGGEGATGPASTLSLGAGAPRLTPLRPSASAHASLAAVKGSAAAAAGSAAAAGASTAAVPAPAARRSASTNDMAALARNSTHSSSGLSAVDGAGQDAAQANTSAAAAAAAAALHEEVLSLLPPGDPALLSPALASRHQENLSRAAALRARAQAGRPVPTLVQSLQANQAFHNPYILSRIAAQMQLANRGYGSNLPSTLWREQNLQVSPGVWKEEDDYLTIRKQAEDAAAARLAGRSSIDFVPATSALTGAAAAGPAVSVAVGGAAAAVPSVVGPPGTSTQVGGHTVATVNADGSITRVRVFDEQPASAATATAAAPTGGGRRSKWDQQTQNPPAPAPPAATLKRPPPGSDALASERDKRARP